MKLSEKITAVLKEIDREKENINSSSSIARDSCELYSDKEYFNFEVKIAKTKLDALNELLEKLIKLLLYM